jgi:hypothetical protein
MMITDTEFLTLHHQRAAELRARAAADRVARSVTSHAPRRIRWPWSAGRQRVGAPARAALR